MKFRTMGVALVAMLLLAAVAPAAQATALPASYGVHSTSGGGPPPDAREWIARRAPRQVSGLPWSRVWIERNLLRNRGR